MNKNDQKNYFQDLKKAFQANRTWYPEHSDQDGMDHPENPTRVKHTAANGKPVWKYNDQTANQHEHAFMGNYQKFMKRSQLSPQGSKLLHSLIRGVVKDPDKHVIGAGTTPNAPKGHQEMRLRHLGAAMAGKHGYSIEESEAGLHVTAPRHSQSSKSDLAASQWTWNGQNLKHDAVKKMLKNSSEMPISSYQQGEIDANRRTTKDSRRQPFPEGRRDGSRSGGSSDDGNRRRNLRKGLKGDWKKEGYELYSMPNTKNSDKFVVYANHPEHGDVGYARFKIVDDDYVVPDDAPGDHMYDASVFVDPEHHRKGLATAMYNLAEQESGLTVRPSEQQTESGEKLWSQPSRSFGKTQQRLLGKAIAKSTGNPIEFDPSKYWSMVIPNEFYTNAPILIKGMRIRTKNRLFVALDGDNIGASVERAAMADDLDTIISQSEKIAAGQAAIRKWAKSHHADIYIDGGDDIAFTIPSKKVKDLDELREIYNKATDFTVTIGVGETISKAGHAMLYGKLNGKDQVNEWSEEVDTFLAETSRKLTPEEKLADHGLLPGGVGDKTKIADVDRKELRNGIRHEMEHTDDPHIAIEIALDHLTEDPKYYTNLADLEKGLRGDWHQEGYRLEYLGPTDSNDTSHFVTAYDPSGKSIGNYDAADEGGRIMGHINIHPEHRRKGLATAMYNLAEEKSGLPVHPNDEQTGDGRRFWESFDSSALEKGSFQRRKPYNPRSQESIDQFKGSNKPREWIHGHLSQDSRESWPRIEGNARDRALHKLSGMTETKVDKEGKRTFLLHRGVGQGEHQNKIDHDTNTAKHKGIWSWTPDHAVATGFSNDQHMNRTLSAWVHEDDIHAVPFQTGTHAFGSRFGRKKHAHEGLARRLKDEKEIMITSNGNRQLEDPQTAFKLSIPHSGYDSAEGETRIPVTAADGYNDDVEQASLNTRINQKIAKSDNNRLRDIADKYAASKGLKLDHGSSTKVDPDKATRIAQAYHEMEHNPHHPKVQAAYGAMIKETSDQFQHLKDSGLKISRIEDHHDNPYPRGSKDMLNDLHNNNHLWYYPTDSGFGSDEEQSHSDHPLLQPSDHHHEGKPLLANDVFRIVHDVFGHGKEGSSFGPHGEENAWGQHMQMYSPLAQKALTSETRGQNSWVNFGPHGENNRKDPANTVYANQKAGLLPDWASESNTPETPNLLKSEDDSYMDLVHFSNTAGLENLSSSHQGSAGAGREDKNISSSRSILDAQKRDYKKQPYLHTYVANTGDAESMFNNAPAKYHIRMPKDKIYDLSQDKLGIFEQVKNDHKGLYAPGEHAISHPDLVHSKIRDAGFLGFKVGSHPDSRFRDSVMFYHDVPVIGKDHHLRSHDDQEHTGVASEFSEHDGWGSTNLKKGS